ncbi:hypothetical protein GCM10009801_56470 [Streptomyces albiaxialis]|uniref:Subtilisin inhibitor domain-containing protein n=1 Tax=Streptomyces albiaxialis TaxID=329523 RepID=A0ABN2WHQ7_9ACTN
MRTITKRVATGAAAVASCLAMTAGAAGTASAAQPAEAPKAAKAAKAAGTSTLVLGVGHGGFTGRMVPSRVVTLECGAYVPGGDHPRAARACDDLERVDGAFSSLVGLNRNDACTKEFSPVTVTVDGYWKGRHVNFAHTFENPCVKRLNASYLFQF